MMITTRVSGKIDPNYLSRNCSKAEHSIALQAERDTRQFIPKRSGKMMNTAKVSGKYIIWDTPYARNMYWGKVMVDPKTHAGGFLTKYGWKSRRGVKKIKSQRQYKYVNGTKRWFDKAKSANIGNWMRLALREVTNGKITTR